jgi:hypothetical protein
MWLWDICKSICRTTLVYKILQSKPFFQQEKETAHGAFLYDEWFVFLGIDSSVHWCAQEWALKFDRHHFRIRF